MFLLLHNKKLSILHPKPVLLPRLRKKIREVTTNLFFISFSKKKVDKHAYFVFVLFYVLLENITSTLISRLQNVG